MSRQAFNHWLERGTGPQRFFKRFLLYFLVLILVYAALDSLGIHFHWELFNERPFVSGGFWARCFFLGVGLAISTIGRRTSIRDNSTI
jgi:hypothetical protein